MNVLVCIAIIIRLTVDLKMLLFRKIVYLMSVVIICFDVPKYLSCVLFASLIAQVRARDFDYFSTDFVRSLFVVYAHDSI